jgi:hypothetical protein
MEAATDAERAVIADGVLTFEEYSNAVAEPSPAWSRRASTWSTPADTDARMG